MNGPDPVFMVFFIMIIIAFPVMMAVIGLKLKERAERRADARMQIIAEAIRQRDQNQPHY